MPLPPPGTLASSRQSSGHGVPGQPKKGGRISLSIGKERKARYLVLRTTSLHLVVEYLRARLFCLGFVDVLHQYTLVFEDVTLGLLVQGVVPFISRSDDRIK